MTGEREEGQQVCLGERMEAGGTTLESALKADMKDVIDTDEDGGRKKPLDRLEGLFVSE